MILEKRLICGCNPDKIFKNNSTFKAHLKTKRHLTFISDSDIKNYKKSSVEYENNIVSQKLRLKELDVENKKLKEKLIFKNKQIYFYLKNIIILIICLNIKFSCLNM